MPYKYDEPEISKIINQSNINADIHITRKAILPEIKEVIYNPPATIVYWADGTKTVVKCKFGDTFSKESGLAIAICKKAYGNEYKFHDVFNKWVK